MGRQTFVLGNGLVLGALDSQSLDPGSMPGTEVCLFILSSPSESPKTIFIIFVHKLQGVQEEKKNLCHCDFHCVLWCMSVG